MLLEKLYGTSVWKMHHVRDMALLILNASHIFLCLSRNKMSLDGWSLGSKETMRTSRFDGIAAGTDVLRRVT